MTIDHEYWEKQGVAKKTTSKQARQMKKNARKLAQAGGNLMAREHVDRATKGHREGVRKGKDQI
jgi:hypothetical protein